MAMLEWAVELASEAPHLSSSLEHQLRNARTAVLLQEAGLERHITSVDSSSVISTLYTELPMLQGDTPGIQYSTMSFYCSYSTCIQLQRQCTGLLTALLTFITLTS